SHVFTWLDSRIDAPKARQIRDLNRRIYDEMNRDGDFRRLPSSLGICYTEMFTGRAPTGHRFVYLPKAAATAKDHPLPVILFLHGSLGNFQGYLWVWKRLADANGFAIVAPSHGIGEWRNDEGLAEVRSAFEYCRAQPGFDASRIYLAGVSNGGAGITHAVPHFPGAFAGIIYLSPVIDPEKIADAAFGEALRGTPVLVITGATDIRVPTDYVTSGVDALKRQGADVTYNVIPDEDHFLIYSQPDEVMQQVGEWLSQPPTTSQAG
ncbi:MAG: prolyl oligopeptidase family serine peptidase, partial [Verrucomicrobiae bacterium]|nr:prolyl oligopeptidase family serine peptidase [Verrucomicrobiae bacterium]